ncbi:tryptophan transporter [Clostridium tarantellae]|uniref:Tryptophan transporter n=1 Tax=Clostridium tarantellae TaxID=39493 RepID=A0A6I1MSN0_9CLOT|nr:tryptophan transporter [Clostridium tarantellae]MPQ45187.1 tryptophan transporter [Clostridium tarantellae]
MNTNKNTKNLIITALLLAIGALLHQITPALGLPMQPDFALTMLFIIIILNKNDYKTILISSLISGIFAAMTTKFPGGQIPNIIDKTLTGNFVFLITLLAYKFKKFNSLNKAKQNYFLALLILPIGTLISGTLFLSSAQILVGLPAPFIILFLTVVLPSILINLIAGIFLFKVISMSLKRAAFR